MSDSSSILLLHDRVIDAFLTLLIDLDLAPSSTSRDDVDDEFLSGVLAGLQAPECPIKTTPMELAVLRDAVERLRVGREDEQTLAGLVAISEGRFGPAVPVDAPTPTPTTAPLDIEGTFLAIAKAISPNHPQSIEFGVSVGGSGWRLCVRTGPRESSDAVGHGTDFAGALLDLARSAAKASRKHAGVLAERAEALRGATQALEAITGDR